MGTFTFQLNFLLFQIFNTFINLFSYVKESRQKVFFNSSNTIIYVTRTRYTCWLSFFFSISYFLGHFFFILPEDDDGSISL